MHATLEACHPITNATYHHAFTDLCFWQDRYFVAYRRAQTHQIVPPGVIVIGCWPTAPFWEGECVSPYTTHTLAHPVGDMRDPKFLVTPDVLYLFCGIYLPWNAVHRDRPPVLMPTSCDNLLQTHITYTTDGETWAPLTPILRPNYWGWSAVQLADGTHKMASYHVGLFNDTTSMVLWQGRVPLVYEISSVVYDASSTEKDGTLYRYRWPMVSEPVLWYDQTNEGLGCCLRTSGTMELGYGRWPYETQDWRWHRTPWYLHPSAILDTAQGMILAARHVPDVLPPARGRKPSPPKARKPPQPTTRLYAFNGRMIQPLLTLPSGGDTAYAGLAPGPDPDTVLVSYYSTHEVPKTVPGARVYLAQVRLTGSC